MKACFVSDSFETCYVIGVRSWCPGFYCQWLSFFVTYSSSEGVSLPRVAFPISHLYVRAVLIRCWSSLAMSAQKHSLTIPNCNSWMSFHWGLFRCRYGVVGCRSDILWGYLFLLRVNGAHCKSLARFSYLWTLWILCRTWTYILSYFSQKHTILFHLPLNVEFGPSWE